MLRTTYIFSCALLRHNATLVVNDQKSRVEPSLKYEVSLVRFFLQKPYKGDVSECISDFPRGTSQGNNTRHDLFCRVLVTGYRHDTRPFMLEHTSSSWHGTVAWLIPPKSSRNLGHLLILDLWYTTMRCLCLIMLNCCPTRVDPVDRPPLVHTICVVAFNLKDTNEKIERNNDVRINTRFTLIYKGE